MEVQEVKEQLKNIFRQVINNDKWITIKPNGEENKGKHLLLKDGESPKEAIERTYGQDKQSDKEEKQESKSYFKPVKGIMQSLKDDYEAGKISAKEVAKELSKANLTSYLLDDNEALEKIGVKQSESKGDLDIKKTTVKMKSGKEKEIEYVDSVPEGYKKLEGAMTAPLGYTWYHNGKSIIDKERKTILVKDKVNNSKEIEMALIEELKKLITRVENNKENEMEIENAKVDKRDIIRQIMAIAGKEEASEDVKTIAKLAEKLAYDKSEAGTADNEMDKEDPDDEKEVKEVKEEVKEDVENKCKNSVDNAKNDYFAKLNEIYNSASSQIKKEAQYVSIADREKAAEEYFKRD